MIRRALLVALCLLPACKCNGKKATARATDAAGHSAGSALPATEPDPSYQATHDELLRRGNPDVMKPAPRYDPNPPAEASATDLVKAVSKDVLMVKSIKVDLAKHRAEIPGKVVKKVGVLEFVAVADHGKAYESLFTVEATAVELRLALTLLGHEGTMPDDKGDVAAPGPGETMRVLVRVGDQERPLSAYLLDRATGKSPPEIAFQVIGFRDASKGEALRCEQFISFVGHEVFAPLRAVADLGNPYVGPDQGLITSKLVPAADQPVTLILEDIPP